MLFFILGGLLALFSLIAFLHRPKKGDGKVKKIPGLSPTNALEGNNPDIRKIGGMPQFIYNLHQQFGPIASFWEGEKLAVSIASPELLKTQRHLGSQALEILEPFVVATGRDCIGVMNGEEVFKRRRIYDHYFMLKGCKSYSTTLLEIAHDYIDKWKNLTPDDHIPLSKTAFTATLKGILQTQFGTYFKSDESVNHLESLWKEISLGIEANPKEDSPEGNKLRKNVKELHGIVEKIFEKRKKEMKTSDKDIFIDLLLGDDIKESQRLGDSVMFLGAGYEPAGKVLMWILYELALNPDVQEKLFNELTTTLEDRQVTLEEIPKLKYLQQVINESMRIALAPVCIGRVTEDDIKVGDYIIPAKTNIYQALGVVMSDPNIWPDPKKFDPERFSASNCKNRNPYAFKPFGFAGKRQCPGQTYAQIKMSIYLAEWCRQFRFKLVPNQIINFVWAQLLRPTEEIWITLEQRN